MTYLRDIVASGNDVIALRHVESFSFGRSDDDALIDKLKGDAVFVIRTVSGLSYSLSVKYQKDTFNNSGLPDDASDGLSLIYTKWQHILAN